MEEFSPIYGRETTEYYYMMIFSVYSIPNIFMLFFDGMLVDKFGNFFFSKYFKNF